MWTSGDAEVGGRGYSFLVIDKIRREKNAKVPVDARASLTCSCRIVKGGGDCCVVEEGG